MDKKTVGLNDTFKGQTTPKSFTKNAIKSVIYNNIKNIFSLNESIKFILYSNTIL